MSYTNESGRRQIIDDSVAAANYLGEAMAALGEAYDLLDDPTADRMEATVFKPVQASVGQLKRTLAEFATRYKLPAPVFETAGLPAPTNPHTTLDRVIELVQAADDTVADLQDSLLPVEVGDTDLRAGLSRARTLIGPVPDAADGLIRMLGR